MQFEYDTIWNPDEIARQCVPLQYSSSSCELLDANLSSMKCVLYRSDIGILVI